MREDIDKLNGMVELLQDRVDLMMKERDKFPAKLEENLRCTNTQLTSSTDITPGPMFSAAQRSEIADIVAAAARFIQMQQSSPSLTSTSLGTSRETLTFSRNETQIKSDYSISNRMKMDLSRMMNDNDFLQKRVRIRPSSEGHDRDTKRGQATLDNITIFLRNNITLI
jgi:phosphoribosyl-dephospho-CoA transferase